MSNTMLYPFKFKPVFKDKIWGGHKIKTILGKDFAPLPNCGEIWVVSGVKGNETVIENGFLAGNNLAEITEVYMDELLGESIYNKFGEEFPILVKFIDAADDLSIQVHPGDELAKKRHNSLGKTEMWYVMDAGKGAKLITGFEKDMDKDTYLQHLKNKTLMDILHAEEVENGDVFYQPAGRVHAIGKGVLLAEIQQSSDVTYRIYDYDRKDDEGKTRELHTDQALDAIDFKAYPEYKTKYDDKLNETSQVVESPYFNTNLLHLNTPFSKDYEELDSFVIHTCVEGRFALIYNDVEKVSLKQGEAVLIPAMMGKVTMIPDGEVKILESYMNLNEKTDVKTELQ
ncbi:MAG TPA: type I phosphomannose isomerase catalytic subunit [Bacteroidales bacterium]|nr:type I phosphomannose isomerase catalytic subunit [Bacteroidales bacterium]